MAANTSFKIQCPSCEAMVPIRDPNLVGKKIDCPKCKYRFVVEEPGGEEGDAEPARKAAKPKAKKKGGNNVLILGSVLGGVALLVLGVVAYLLFGGGDTAPPKNTPRPPVAASSTPPASAPSAAAPAEAATPTPDVTANKPAADSPPAPTAPVAVVLDPGHQEPVPEITNLLPNETQSVISINMDRLRSSTLGQQAFDPGSHIGFRPDTFKSGFGIGVEDISWFLRAENFGQNWSFNVMKIHRPVTLTDFQTALKLTKGPKGTIQGRNYFVIAPNPLLDHLSTILQSEIESREARTATRKRESSGPLTLVLLDDTTVVVAHRDIMEEFLEANAQPPKKATVLGSETPPAGDPAPGRRGLGAAAPGGAAGGPQFADKNSYLTIDPHLKTMLERLEQDRDNVVVSLAQRLQADATIVDRVREATGFKQLEVNGMNILGVGLNQLNDQKCQGEVAVEFIREQTAKEFEDALKTQMPFVGTALSLYLNGLRIQVDGAPAGPGNGSGPGMRPPGGPTSADGNSPDGPPGSTEPPKSSLKLERKGRTLLLNLDLSLNERAYDRIYALSQGTVMRMKGMVDMASGERRLFELADAALRFRNDALKKGDKEVKPANSFPRGTFPREDTQGRLSRIWPPSQRVSWMAGLLPFLGYQEIYDDIQINQSWRSEANIKQGSVLIPAFLNPRYPRPAWRAHPPSLGIMDLGATHFVGVAGIGMDAADYRADDPDKVKKLGVFGYERRTTVKDITDGVSNTIYMIQVPPTHPRPWIAGGGATVTGIPETRSIQPFVSTQGGKRGTYVLMCDGSVRFIKDDISDDVFKALCTIKGGEEIADLNQVAPKDEPKGPSMKTAEAAKKDEQ